MIELWTAVCSGLLAFFALGIWYTSPKYSPYEPPPIPHFIPLIGHLIPFAKDRRSLFGKFSQLTKNQPYSMYVAGRKHYVFSKPNAYTAVYRNSKTLDIGNFVKLLITKWFGYSNEMAERYKAMKSDWEELHNNLLLREENSKPTAIKYFILLEEELRNLDSELENSATGAVTKEGRQLVLEVQGSASTIAYFGKKPFEENPELLDDLVVFNSDGFWALLMSAPRFLYPKPYAAKDRIIAAFQGLSDTIDAQDDVSDYIRSRHKLVAKKMNSESQGSDKFNIFFGLNANSFPNAYCYFLEVLSNPEIVSEIRSELEAAGYPALHPSEYVTVIPSKVPFLRSLYYESLRVHVNAVNFREVTSPTDLVIDDHTWKLEKGGVVTLVGTILHEDEEYHPQPKQFQPRRFMDKAAGGGGEIVAKYTKPFGGGTSYCPGRIFAEKQIIGFVAAMVMRYDMEIVTKDFVIPRSSDLEFVASQPPVYIEIKKRTSI